MGQPATSAARIQTGWKLLRRMIRPDALANSRPSGPSQVAVSSSISPRSSVRLLGKIDVRTLPFLGADQRLETHPERTHHPLRRPHPGRQLTMKPSRPVTQRTGQSPREEALRESTSIKRVTQPAVEDASLAGSPRWMQRSRSVAVGNVLVARAGDLAPPPDLDEGGGRARARCLTLLTGAEAVARCRCLVRTRPWRRSRGCGCRGPRAA